MGSLPMHLRPELSKEWTKFTIDLSACVQSCKQGVPLASLKVDFAEYLCYELPVEKFGFQSVHDLVSAARDVVELAKDPGTHQLMVKACVTEKTAHIAAMIAAQRSVPARKRRGGRGKGVSRGYSASSWAPRGRGSAPHRGPPAGYGRIATSATLRPSRPVPYREFSSSSSSRGRGATRGSHNIQGRGQVAGSVAATVHSQTHQPGNQRNHSDVRLAPRAEPARANSVSGQTKGAAIPTGGNDASEKQQSQTASPSSVYIAFGRGRGRGIGLGLVEPQLPLGFGVTAPPACSTPTSVQSIDETRQTSTPTAPVELSRMDSWLRSLPSPSPNAPLGPQQISTGLENVDRYSRGSPTPSRAPSVPPGFEAFYPTENVSSRPVSASTPTSSFGSYQSSSGEANVISRPRSSSTPKFPPGLEMWCLHEIVDDGPYENVFSPSIPADVPAELPRPEVTDQTSVRDFASFGRVHEAERILNMPDDEYRDTMNVIDLLKEFCSPRSESANSSSIDKSDEDVMWAKNVLRPTGRHTEKFAPWQALRQTKKPSGGDFSKQLDSVAARRRSVHSLRSSVQELVELCDRAMVEVRVYKDAFGVGNESQVSTSSDQVEEPSSEEIHPAIDPRLLRAVDASPFVPSTFNSDENGASVAAADDILSLLDEAIECARQRKEMTNEDDLEVQQEDPVAKKEKPSLEITENIDPPLLRVVEAANDEPYVVIEIPEDEVSTTVDSRFLRGVDTAPFVPSTTIHGSSEESEVKTVDLTEEMPSKNEIRAATEKAAALPSLCLSSVDERCDSNVLQNDSEDNHLDPRLLRAVGAAPFCPSSAMIDEDPKIETDVVRVGALQVHHGAMAAPSCPSLAHPTPSSTSGNGSLEGCPFVMSTPSVGHAVGPVVPTGPPHVIGGIVNPQPMFFPGMVTAPTQQPNPQQIMVQPLVPGPFVPLLPIAPYYTFRPVVFRRL